MPKKTYTVYARVTLEMGANVQADSFAAAAAEAEKLKVADFVTILNKQAYLDGEWHITSISDVGA